MLPDVDQKAEKLRKVVGKVGIEIALARWEPIKTGDKGGAFSAKIA